MREEKGYMQLLFEKKVMDNDDLLAEILIRLPPKPLMRSKSVSRHWLSVISDHQFLISYTRHHRKTHLPSSVSQFYRDCYHDRSNHETCISLDGNCDTIPKLDFLESSNDSNFRILNSCNGLFLCQHRRGEPFIVFNPTTKKYRLLPEPSYGYVVDNVMKLTFDPCVSFHYKVVNFRAPHSNQTESNCRDLSIFSSESWSWKEVSLAVPQSLSCKVFWNGAINWIGYNNSHVRFHVEEEKFTQIQLPNTLVVDEKAKYIGECDTGLFVIMKTLEFNQNRVLHILEMNKDSNCWAIKYRVHFRHLISEFPEIGIAVAGKYHVLYVKREANKKSFSFVVCIRGKIILHSVSVDKEGNNNFPATTRIIKNSTDCDISDSDSRYHPFIQCLVPI